MRIAIFVLLPLLSTGCGLDSRQDASRVEAPEGTSSDSTAVASESSRPPPAGSTDESSPQAPTAEPGWFFVGRWASNVENCRDDAWVITAQELHTPGHVSCTFDAVSATPRGAEAKATCTAEGPPQRWTLQFSYAESARALLIEEGPFEDVGLVACKAP
jgi:hypothetical protein